MIERGHYIDLLKERVGRYAVTALLGPRQTGKTTLARVLGEVYGREGKGEVHYFDLESPASMVALENPERALGGLSGLVIIDEIQRREDLFPILRVLADRRPMPARFLVLGSASGGLLRQSSESLAGRIAYIELSGFGIGEVSEVDLERLWLRGGFPESFLGGSDQVSFTWRENFIKTLMERDIPALGVRVPSFQLWRFLQMAAHYHGQTWNSSEIAKSLQVTDKTVRSYLDIFTETFIVRQLPPHYENMGKRIVKAPKFYIRDSGIFHGLLGVRNKSELLMHPKLGASWEGFALEQIINLSGRGDRASFWKVNQGVEVDLLLPDGPDKVGFEVKYSDAPRLTKSMCAVRDMLNLKHLYVVYPGSMRYYMAEGITAVPLGEVGLVFGGG